MNNMHVTVRGQPSAVVPEHHPPFLEVLQLGSGDTSLQSWHSGELIFVSSRPTWSTERVLDQPGLHRETLLGKTNKQKSVSWTLGSYSQHPHKVICFVFQVWALEKMLPKAYPCVTRVATHLPVNYKLDRTMVFSSFVFGVCCPHGHIVFCVK